MRSEIPLYNLANTRFQQGDFSAAHDLYQRALGLRPNFKEALFNDGVALYGWGLREIDPQGCMLDRTKELWSAALLRFEEAARAAGEDEELARKARDNAEFVRARFKDLEQLGKNCPENPGGGSREEPPREKQSS